MPIALTGLAILLMSMSRKSLVKKSLIAITTSFGELDSEQIKSVESIVNAFKIYGDKDTNKLAYILATAWHESKLRPVKEIRAKVGTELYETQNKYWFTGYYGRGYVQLTWKNNYQKMSDFLNVDLVNNPDLALLPEYASKILVYGMINGSFTRRSNGVPYKLSDFISINGFSDFFNARRVVNWLDKAQLINDYTINIIRNA